MTSEQNQVLCDRAAIADCLRHLQNLPPHIKERTTAQMLAFAIEIAARLFLENEKLRFQNSLTRGE